MQPHPLSTTSDSDLDRLARLADSAVRHAARLTPKPGLPDARNTGAVALHTVLRGADALAPWWGVFARCGTTHSDDGQLRDALRSVRGEADRAVRRATGVSTHEGTIVAFGSLLACAGRRVSRGAAVDLGVCDEVADVAALFDGPPRHEDHAGQAHPPHPAAGFSAAPASMSLPRSEFPPPSRHPSPFVAARDVGLVAYREAMELLATQPHLALGPMMRERALLHALLALLAVNSDADLLRSGGPEAVALVADRARHLLTIGGALHPGYLSLIQALDDELAAAGLSPRSTADLLAVTIWLSCLPQTTTGRSRARR